MKYKLFKNSLLRIGIIFSSACTLGANSKQLKTRAAFDLDCPASQLEIIPIDKRTKGVKGCGERLVYVEQCRTCANGNGYVGCDCTWVLNSDTRPNK